MDNTTNRLTACFRMVFPDLPEARIVTAHQAAVGAWDSVATVTLLNVIEEEFGIQMDLEMIDQFDSFHNIQEYVRREQNGS